MLSAVRSKFGSRMLMSLPKLSYGLGDLAPTISEHNMDLHYNKHHNTYVVNANKLVEESLTNEDLPEIIKKAMAEGNKPIYNNAAQIFNHSFFWECMTPGGSKVPTELEKALADQFGSFDTFKEIFSDVATKTFGSGWAWLVKDSESNLRIMSTANADTPITEDLTPILTLDVWEHAYYPSYENRRPEYIKEWWNIVNWDFALEQFQK
eukprot:TRINITY_DN67965_c0_g1_i1.p1 TRINITY_DN67965_c0_g1~~TRINITY_DN67965_c0_g1_i1.p1  ORF type:complete len:224 (-),score=42.36 TRINITY_DN67965_c0_g1_i1:640-1263(-)